MEAFTALLESATRILVAGFTAAPLAWVIAILLLMLGLAAVALRRRPVARGDVETIFLASAAATRKAREIGEIDAFARRAWAAAEELKARERRRLRAVTTSRSRSTSTTRTSSRPGHRAVHGRERPLEHDIDWPMLPQVLLEETGEWLTKARKAPQALLYRGMHVYGTLFEDSYFKLLETMLRHEQTAPDKLPLPIRLRKETIDKLARGERAAQGGADAADPAGRHRLRDGADLPAHAARGPAVELQVHIRRHSHRAGEDARHPHRHRSDRRRNLRCLRHCPHPLGGQRLRARRGVRAGNAQQAGDPRRLRRAHQRFARQHAGTASILPKAIFSAACSVPPRSEGKGYTLLSSRPWALAREPGPRAPSSAAASAALGSRILRFAQLRDDRCGTVAT